MLKVFDSESEIGSALRRFRFAIGQISIISAVLNILMLGGSFFMLLVYDEVLPSRSIPTLVGLLIIITIVYCFQGVLDLLRSRAMIQTGALVGPGNTPRVFDVITKMELRRREMPEGRRPRAIWTRSAPMFRVGAAGPARSAVGLSLSGRLVHVPLDAGRARRSALSCWSPS